MKKNLSFLFGALLVLSILGCSNGQLISAKDQRVTFALVLDDRSFNGKTVIADLIENDADKTHRGTLQGVLASYPNTTFQAWAQLTVLDSIHTNIMYFLDFFIDMDGNGTVSVGDRTGVQAFYVAPSAIWSETKYYAAELGTVTVP